MRLRGCGLGGNGCESVDEVDEREDGAVDVIVGDWDSLLVHGGRLKGGGVCF
jgi:hypothetical protein